MCFRAISGAEYLALIVRYTRRLRGLRAHRDAGGMAGMFLLSIVNIAYVFVVIF